MLTSLILAPCVIAKEPKTIKGYDEVFNKAQKYLDKNQNEKAINILTELPLTDISSADDTTKVFYNLLLGKAYLFGQKNELADKHLEKRCLCLNNFDSSIRHILICWYFEHLPAMH